MLARARSWRLLSLLVATFAAVGVLSTSALAEDYTTNTVAGVVQDTSGNVISGATITLTSEKGVNRTSTAGSDGKFRMPQLPLGSYVATVSADGFESLSSGLFNRLGGGGQYTFTMMPAGGEIDEIVTTGVQQASMDFESNTAGISVDVGELQTKYPVARSLTDVALFAPGTQRGDTGFNTRSDGSLASFTGGSVAENAYYINGMNITNFRTFTGGSTIPFEFFDQVEVKTGGYQAEFGRSMGGFVNAVSKSGSNDFNFEVTAYWTPEGSRETRPDVQTTWNSLDYDSNSQYVFQASGPIIKDRLFFYALYNERDVAEEDYTNSTMVKTIDAEPFMAAKLDFVPFDGHRLEYTFFTDERRINQTVYDFNDLGADRSDVSGNEVGAEVGPGFTLAGGDNHIWKYTAVINDAFSVSAMYGENDFNRTTQSVQDANPVIYERMTNPSSSTRLGSFVNTYAASGFDSREAIRIDADIYFEAAGDHHIRVGWDKEDLNSSEESTLSGGEYWRFHYCTDVDGCFQTGANPVAFNEEYVRHLIIDQGGNFDIEQTAMYIQDSWEMTDQLTVNLGLRSEKFKNYNADGIIFIETDDQIAPRIGATYDLRGDGRTLLSAFFGRYYMPIAANTNIRMSGAELFIQEYLKHAGFDNRNPDDTPTGVDYANPASYSLASDGTVPPVDTIKAENVDPLFSDEWILGFEHAFDNDWVMGVRYVQRELSTQIDDIGINPAIVAWALENGWDLNDEIGGGHGGGNYLYELMAKDEFSIEYVLANPGEDITVATDLLEMDGSLTVMNLTSEMLGYEKPKREYKSVEFTMEKETEDWGVNASYVWASNEGNTEGMVKSDNAQADPGLTQDFDLAGLAINAYGPLPTEVEHQLKVSGFYVVNEQFRVGATARVRAPRKFGCFGVLPEGIYGNSAEAYSYDPETMTSTGNLAGLRQEYEARYDDDYWFCDGESGARGTQMEADWTKDIDVSMTYTPNSDALPGALSFRVDVFNLLNDDGVTDLFERGEDLGGALDNYGTASAYNAPRKVRLSVNWKF
jgi:hypothetical protein